jgi:hypothetical protein
MNVLRALLDAGLTIESDGELLVVSPAGHITPDIRTLIRENKPSLLAYVRQVEQGSATLIAAINRCCNARGDDPKNRAELIDECGRLLRAGRRRCKSTSSNRPQFGKRQTAELPHDRRSVALHGCRSVRCSGDARADRDGDRQNKRSGVPKRTRYGRRSRFG